MAMKATTTLGMLFAAIAGAVAQQEPPYIRTVNGNVHVVPAEGKQLVITDGGEAVAFSDVRSAISSNTDAISANTEAISANAVSITNLSSRTDLVDATLGLGRRDTHTQGPSLIELTQSIVELNQRHTVLLGAIANATNEAIVAVSPSEVGATGGDTVYVGGRNLLAGVPGLYQCHWTYSHPDSSTTVAHSVPAMATTSSLIECVAPAWPHPPALTEYICDFTVTRADSGTLIPYRNGAETLQHVVANELPTMSYLSDYETGISQVLRHVLYIQVSDPDGADTSRVVITSSFTNASLLQSVTVSPTGYNRTVTIDLAPSARGECGSSNITLTATDALGESTTQTFQFTQCDSFVTIIRTDNSRSDSSNFGPGMRLLQGTIRTDTGSNFGAFTPMRTMTGVRKIKITQTSGSQAGRFAVFQLVAPLQGTVYDSIMQCGQTSAYTNSPATTSWTSAYSGTKVEGTLDVFQRGQRAPLRYMYLCGVNLSSDDDHSVLAFTHYTGQNNDWGDQWRGTGQLGTIWSLYNNDYLNDRGWDNIESYPGWKADGTNAGTYEISVSVSV